MKMRKVVCLLFVLIWSYLGTNVWAVDFGWMQKGVRVWYLGAVDSGGVISSNAEEAYLLGAFSGANVRVTHHSALDQWNSPRAVQTATYPVFDKGPCWIHPAVLQNLQPGNDWMGQEIVTVLPSTYTYDTFRDATVPYHFLPIKALFDLKPQRVLVKITYMIADFSTGRAYFDAETGLLLYYDSMWEASKLFFILSEINYDFGGRRAFAEDYGPHTGFKSFASEQSMVFPVGGGSVVIQSLFESRYGNTMEMRVLSSISSATGYKTWDENYCFFGDIPVLRRMDATQALNFPPEQWNPFGQYLWWWIPPTALKLPKINVYDVLMNRTATQPYTFTSAEDPQRFYFTDLWLGNDGYMTQFSAKDPTIGLVLNVTDDIFQNSTTVNGLNYYRSTMGRATPLGLEAVNPVLGLLLSD